MVKRLSGFFILFLIVMSLLGCGKAASESVPRVSQVANSFKFDHSIPSMNISDADIPVNSFKAFYFDPVSSSNLVFSENVSMISIKPNDEVYKKINSEKFEGYWVGYLAFDSDVQKQIVINQLNPKVTYLYGTLVTLKVNDVVIYRGGESKVIEYSFTKGKHKIEVLYSFRGDADYRLSVWFPDKVKVLSRSEANVELSSIIESSDEAWYTAAREPLSKDNSLEVNLNTTTKNIILFLSSHMPVKWKISAKNSINVKAIVYSSEFPGGEIDLPGSLLGTTLLKVAPGIIEVATSNNQIGVVSSELQSIFGKYLSAYSPNPSGANVTLPNIYLYQLDDKVAVPVSEIPVNSFKAIYTEYGSREALVSENVDIIACNFDERHHTGIVAKTLFMGYWVGDLEFEKETRKYIGIDNDSSSNVSLWVDGKLVHKTRPRSPSSFISHTFSKGRHRVVVRFMSRVSKSSSIRLNVSFLDNKEMPFVDMYTKLSSLSRKSDVVWALDLYGSTATDNSVVVTPRPFNKPVILFLSSHRSVRWKINNPNNVKIKAIVYSDYGNGSTVALPSGVGYLPHLMYIDNQAVVYEGHPYSSKLESDLYAHRGNISSPAVFEGRTQLNLASEVFVLGLSRVASKKETYRFITNL